VLLLRAAARWLLGPLLAVAAVVALVVVVPPSDGDDPRPPVTGAWKALPDAGIAGRSEPSVVWTRKAMIVWGGAGGSGVLGDGASYDLATDRWTPLAPAPLSPRRGQSAVWTGTKMVVFGGQGPREGCEGLCALGDGAAYDPISNAWTPLAPAPIAPRHGHTAVYLQNRMVVWGGAAQGGAALGDGASYDPVANTWTAVPVPPVAPRLGHRAAATTDRMLVWGGSSEAAEGGRYFSDGAVYNPATHPWSTMAAPPAALEGRDNAAGVWTGERLVVWGGYGRSETCTPCFFGDGAAYDLTSDTWAPIAPSPLNGRGAHRAVWTGREMLVWGGFDSAVQGDGALYSPFDDAWVRLGPGPLAARQHHAMVWTGQQLIVWGGAGAAGMLADGAVLTPRAF
jgi:N-acetylneuraminic acid mutarotase